MEVLPGETRSVSLVGSASTEDPMGSEVAGSIPAAAVLFRRGFLGAGGATALKLSRFITPTTKLITTKNCLRWLAKWSSTGL